MRVRSVSNNKFQIGHSLYSQLVELFKNKSSNPAHKEILNSQSFKSLVNDTEYALKKFNENNKIPEEVAKVLNTAKVNASIMHTGGLAF